MPNVVRVLFIYSLTLTEGETWDILCVWMLISIYILCPNILEVFG